MKGESKMATEKWWITGDIHGNVQGLAAYIDNHIKWENIDNLIILGDAGFNYYIENGEDTPNSIAMKRAAAALDVIIYCVRGNHEARPDAVEGIERYYDDTVENYIYLQEDYPNIHYFIDGLTYNINGYKTLVLGGAYSIDKDTRIAQNLKWFDNEQLSLEEQRQIGTRVLGESFDMCLSHTCPLEFFPPDLPRYKVDDRTELFLSHIEASCRIKKWYCGHYHINKYVGKCRFLYDITEPYKI